MTGEINHSPWMPCNMNNLNPPSVFSHEVTRRKKEYPNLLNEKFLGFQNPFYKKGFGRRRQK
jgi:hypothetical protein